MDTPDFGRIQYLTPALHLSETLPRWDLPPELSYRLLGAACRQHGEVEDRAVALDLALAIELEPAIREAPGQRR